jgi:hypothetical protein
MGRANGIVRGVALVALGALLAATVAGLAASRTPGPAKRDPSPAHSIRATGVGLPRIGAQGTLGIGEFTQAVRDYHDSGAYERDLERGGSRARAFLLRQTRALRGRARLRCRRAKRGRRKAALRRACRRPKLAVVLDIDETSLSHYEELQATNFSGATAALAAAVISADSPPIAPTLAVYRAARARRISVFFITGRPQISEMPTTQNLDAAGYRERAGLSFKPNDAATIPFKSGQRAKIEKRGFRVVVNVGDQESDLAGGHADRSFKLPNPFYFIG